MNIPEEEFEKWAADHGYSLSKQLKGEYVSQPTQNVHKAWQAALAAATTPPPAIKPCVKPYKSHQCLDCGTVIEPTPAPEVDPGEYYLQDSRQYVGNNMLFWADGGGYTTDLCKAEVFTHEAALRQHLSRNTDILWPRGYINSKSRPAVDMQYVKRSDVIAAMPGAK